MHGRHLRALFVAVLAAALQQEVRSHGICRGSPKNPANGKFSCRNTAIGQSCTAKCNSGFAGNPSPSAACVQHGHGQHKAIGKWTRVQGKCSPIACPGNPTQPAFGLFNCTTGFIGSRCEAKCDSGYTGSPTSTCTTIPGAPAWSTSGKWSDVTGTCKPEMGEGDSLCTYGAGETPEKYTQFPDGTKGPLHECCFNDNDYCGGDTNRPIGVDAERYHMSCTSFPARLSNLAKVQTLNWCKDPRVDVFAGPKVGMGQSRMWKADGQMVDDWWVFHGCDGAGLMSDCLGGFMYAEHYMIPNKPDVAYDVRKDAYVATSTLPNGGMYNDVKNDPVPCTNVQTCWKRHTRSFYTHPGTNAVTNLDAGMWDLNDWKEKNKLWFQDYRDQGLKDPQEYYTTYLQNSKKGYAAVMTYPWVCNTENTQGMPVGTTPANKNKMYKDYFLTKLWGDRPNWNNNPVPFYPHQDIVDCYYDNEPWSGDHDARHYGPPIWEAYIFWADDLQGRYISGVRVAWKNKDDQVHVIAPGDRQTLDNGKFTLTFIK